MADDVAAESTGAAAAASPDMFGNIAAVDSQGAAPTDMSTPSRLPSSLKLAVGSALTASLASPPMTDDAAAEAAAAATSPPRRRDALLHRLAHVFCLNTLLPERL